MSNTTTALLPRPIHESLWLKNICFADITKSFINREFYNNHNNIVIGSNTYDECNIVKYHDESYSFQYQEGIYTVVASTLLLLFENNNLLDVCELPY